MIHVTHIQKLLILISLLLGYWTGASAAADWPTWHGNPGRTCAVDEALPDELHLQWILELPKPKACWPTNQHKLQFDASYEPVVMDGQIFVPSMVRDSLTAYDTATGEEQWRFYADGPVRFAPVASAGKVYFVSDDGYLYCLSASNGQLCWKFRGGPDDRQILGNERLISTWPARGAPVLVDGVVYFAASIWPFMGTYIHALDAESGQAVWTNSGSGSDFILQPHASPAFAGVAPQGYLAVCGDKLFVAGGRSVPAVYDRNTGAFLYHQANTKRGSYATAIADDWFFNDGYMYRIKDGKQFAESNATVFADDTMFSVNTDGLLEASKITPTYMESVDRKGQPTEIVMLEKRFASSRPMGINRIFLKAGQRLYGGHANGTIAAFALATDENNPSSIPIGFAEDPVVWQTRIDGTPWSMLATNGQLFVVTEEGSIYCFGEKTTPFKRHSPSPYTPYVINDHWRHQARQILKTTEMREGYCLVLGLGTGQLADALVRQSDLHVIGLDADAKKVNRLRREFDDANLYGDRIELHTLDFLTTPMAPYMANLVVFEDPTSIGLDDDRFPAQLFNVLRPYGGVACLNRKAIDISAFRKNVAEQNLPNAVLRKSGNLLMLSREGALPGSAPWTHQYGNVANTVCSPDTRVKPPLGLLWFGGPSHADVLPRHSHGPCQQVMQGRLFIQGIKVFSARDVYTGRVLWRRELPELNTFGMYFNETFNPDIYDRSYNQVHIPGANALGSNFVVTPDRIYLSLGSSCLVLDPATGQTLSEWTLPFKEGIGQMNFGYLGVYEDLLIVGAAPLHIEGSGKQEVVIPNNRYGRGSRYIVVLDRFTGRPIWERKSTWNFRHNMIIAGTGKIFCVDGMSESRLATLRRRGIDNKSEPRLLALDAHTGREIWNKQEPVFGTWLSYSERYDIVLQAGSHAGDRANDEVKQNMAAFRGKDGKLLWEINDRYDGPCIIHGDQIFTQTGGGNTQAAPARSYDLLTGKTLTTEHPLTGEQIPLTWVRFKGCNTAIASEHLLTFRSASAAYVDLNTCDNPGTTFIGGFKSGCTSNLVAADGVLNAPDYTRTCTCSYQNQTSLALVPVDESLVNDPDVEGWSINFYPAPEKATPITSVGINFGAPGNRFDETGKLWIEYPSVGGPSPDLPISIEPADARLYRRHMSSIIKDVPNSPAWINSSGVDGVRTITICPFLQPAPDNANKEVNAFEQNAFTRELRNDLSDVQGQFDRPRPYTVRLHFAEPEAVKPGERVFDIYLQGSKVVEGFDIVKIAEGENQSTTLTFEAVPVSDKLIIGFEPENASKLPPLICGLDLFAETGAITK